MIKKNALTGEKKIVPPFTDDDLKRLKEGIKAAIPMKPIGMYIVEMEALLTRLEAAERVCNTLLLVRDAASEEIQKHYRVWRRAAGK